MALIADIEPEDVEGMVTDEVAGQAYDDAFVLLDSYGFSVEFSWEALEDVERMLGRLRSEREGS